MKIVGIYQLYLGYVLPRLNEGEEAGQIGIDAGDFRAWVRPKELGDPLFPEDIDVTLSSMQISIARADGSEGKLDFAVESTCLDRVQVVLEWEVDPDAFDVDEEFQRSLDRVTIMADYYLDHLRFVANSPFVKRIDRSWRTRDDRFVINVPYSCTWFNGDDRSSLGVFGPGVNGAAKSNSIRSPETGVADLAALETSLGTALPPPLHRSLIIDAEEHLHGTVLREAVLSMASACEIAAHLLIARNGGERDGTITPVLSRRNVPFAQRYYDDLPSAVAARSLRTEDAESFDLVQEMYGQRNWLMHRGAFKDDFLDLGRRDQHRRVHSWLVAARTAVSWIDTI